MIMESLLSLCNEKGEQIRDFIMTLLIETIGLNNQEFTVLCLQIIADFCKHYYDFIDKYIIKLSDFVNAFISLDDEKLATSSIEIWSSIAEEELERIE